MGKARVGMNRMLDGIDESGGARLAGLIADSEPIRYALAIMVAFATADAAMLAYGARSVAADFKRATGGTLSSARSRA